jgi:Kef-type K+ transport system membrane component KefB
MNAFADNLELSALTLLGAATLIGFYAGRGTQWIRLPSIIGYMLLGVAVGPSAFGFFGHEQLDHVGFITQIVLGYVAFSIGAELSIASLRSLGRGIIAIILAESFTAFFVVLGFVFALTQDWVMSLVFAAMAPASAPAGTVAVILETRAKGPLTKALYAVVGFDDGLAIIIFGFAAAIARSLLTAEATGQAESILPALVDPFREVILSIVVGGIVGLIFCQIVRRLQAPAEYFAIVFGTIALVTGLSLRWHLSLILTNMIVGFILVNTRRESLVNHVTSPLANVMPLMFILFFCLAGAHLEIGALPALGMIGIVYIAGRTIGLLLGARIGSALGHVPDVVKKNIGLGILSQAGVAIGLALILNQEFGELAIELDFPKAAAVGASVLTTVTATSIFFETIGPICTKIALTRAGEVGKA